jgi:hypothetical protein
VWCGVVWCVFEKFHVNGFYTRLNLVDDDGPKFK